MLNIMRIKFLRGEEVKYISHLDLMKLFERALRRSKIPIAYSQGFNPHPQMVFGLPLSVGVTSEAEYADFEFAENMDPEEFKQRLNNNLPKGMKVLEAVQRNSKDNIMAAISGASYDILLSLEEKTEIATIEDNINNFLNQPSIIVKKESKRGTKEVDIKPMIYDIKVCVLEGKETDEAKNTEKQSFLKNYINQQFNGENLRPKYKSENIFCLSVLLSAGSVSNLKAELLVSALREYIGMGIIFVKTHRTGLFVGKDKRLISPLDKGVL